MRKEGNDEVKIGYNEATAMKRSDLKTDLALTEKYGYDYIEIRLDMLENYLTSNSINDLKFFFSNSRLKPYALNAIEEINFCDRAGFLKVEEKTKWACSMAEKINNPFLIVVPSFRKNAVQNSSKSDIEADSAAVLNRLADISEEYNVKIAFEPVGFKACAVRDIETAWDIVQKVDRDSVGLVIDAFNLFLYNGLKDIDIIREIDPAKIFVFHIDDCEGGVPFENLQLEHRVWPGDGIIPLVPLLSILKEKGFGRIASIELFRPEYWKLPPDVAIRTALEKTKKILKTI
jgi:2-keto-myo-inositol isomerase